jgi:hypothetical protein
MREIEKAIKEGKDIQVKVKLWFLVIFV